MKYLLILLLLAACSPKEVIPTPPEPVQSQDTGDVNWGPTPGPSPTPAEVKAKKVKKVKKHIDKN